MYNTITAVAYLVRDPEIRTTTGGKKVVSLRVGISPSRAKTKCFIDVEYWDKTAEIAAEYLNKGREFLFTGELSMDSWEKDGEKKTKYFIRGRELQFLNSGKKDDDKDAPDGGGGEPASSGGAATNSDADDIPF